MSHHGLLVASAVATGLMAGVFFAFSTAVMPGLARGSDRTFVETMRQVNAAIQNPLFFLGFFGSALLPAAAAWWSHRAGDGPATAWALVGLGCSLVSFLVTVVVNVPLNNRLDAAGEDFTAARAAYERPWNRANTIRTLACTAALAALAWAAA
ncbi:anthrone oxygenase family protein [Actinokineospora pegani]|uniref:anthrone oxygenase family protein n=1 Tax=Actinokineospora pegani TaxID=2654637 RepID=UPI0012EACF96|nr:anthrone oxygenase family protein [Actinokineospora pegani]